MFLKDSIKRRLNQSSTLYRVIRLFRRTYQAKMIGPWNWAPILTQLNELQTNKDSINRHDPCLVKVLLATSIGGFFPAATLESLVGLALKQRGVEVHVLLCDSVLPACMDCDVTWYPNQEQFLQHGPSKDLCLACFEPAAKIFRALGIVVHKYSEWIPGDEIEEAQKTSSQVPYEEIPGFVWEGVHVGENALAGALRFFARATLDDEPHAQAVLRRFFYAALIAGYVTRNLLMNNRFECAVFHHGIYVPQGIIGEVARKYDVRVVNWNPAYRKNCFIFSHERTYHHTMMEEPTTSWEDLPWTAQMDKKLTTYLQSRERGTQDWIYFHERPIDELDPWVRDSNLDLNKPCIGLLTNVMWDAQLHYPQNAFVTMLEWILQTIDYFSQRSELQLIIRVHPAERSGAIPSRQFVVDEVKKVFHDLPSNVFLIEPDNRLSTYSVMKMCNAVLIYGTKMGVELCSAGIPVIVAGEAWIRNKGLTYDVMNKKEYFHLLDRLPFLDRMSALHTERSKKYAYHFFFRRMIPITSLKPLGNWPLYRVSVSQLEDLKLGVDPGLDLICEGILSGVPFVYQEELTEEHLKQKAVTKHSA